MSIEYHEPWDKLSEPARDLHRALTSLVEELEAVAWYHQRVEVTSDEDLGRILQHNLDEECEHAAMALEWIRKRIPALDENLKKFLFQNDDK